MTKKDIQLIEESLSIIIGQPLRYLGRAGAMIIMNFGKLVEVKGVALRDKNEKLALEVIYYKGGKRKPTKISWQRLIRSGIKQFQVTKKKGGQYAELDRIAA